MITFNNYADVQAGLDAFVGQAGVLCQIRSCNS